MTQPIGLYPGTFDPITLGHFDVIKRALKIVDTLVIGVAANVGKGPMFTLEERIAIVEEEAASFEAGKTILVRPFEGLLVRFAEEVGAQIIVRGLRAVADFEYEIQMTAMNQQLNRDIETVFFMADSSHRAISSSLVKEIAKLGGDVSAFVPPGVLRRLNGKFA